MATSAAARDVDRSDAVSVSSDADAPLPQSPPSVLPNPFRDLNCTERDEVLRLMDLVRPGVPESNPLIARGIFKVSIIARFLLEYKPTRRTAVYICDRVLTFYLDVIQSNQSLSCSSPFGSWPATLLSFVLNDLFRELENIVSDIGQWARFSRHGYSAPSSRSQTRLAATHAARTIREIIPGYRRSLGLVSKAFKMAYPDLGDVNKHPFTLSALRDAFSDQLYTIVTTYARSRHRIVATFPDTCWYEQLYGFLRRIELARDDLVEPETSDLSSQDHPAVAHAQHAMGEEGPTPEDEADEFDYQITPDSYIDFIDQELDADCMAFADEQSLVTWRSLGDLRVSEMASRTSARRGLLLSEPNPHQLLGFLIIESCKLECFKQASVFAELLVIHFRWRAKHAPASFSSYLDLINALAAYATINRQRKEHQEASVIAMEEAKLWLTLIKTAFRMQDSLSPPPSVESLTPILRLSYAHILDDDNASPHQTGVLQQRKALRNALQAIPLVRAQQERVPTSPAAQLALANAVRLGAEIGLHLLEVMSHAQDFHAFCTRELGVHSEYPRFKKSIVRFHQHLNEAGYMCSAANDDPLVVYTHRKLGDFSLCTIDDVLKMAEEAVVLYRQLASGQPRKYEPILARACCLLAEAADLQPSKAVAALEEATEIYERLTATVGEKFNRQLGEAYCQLAWHLRSENDMEPACAALAEAAHYQQKPQNVEEVWRGWYHAATAALSARAMLCAHLERYDDAVADAEQAVPAFARIRARRVKPPGDLAEALASKGYALWMKGDVRRAREALRDGLALMDRRDGKEPERDTTYMLLRAWRGCIQATSQASSLSSISSATTTRGGGGSGRHEVEEAVWLAEALTDSLQSLEPDASERRVAEEMLVPPQRALPHLLVLLAAVLAREGAVQEAHGRLEQAKALWKADGKARDRSTVKTAVRLREKMVAMDAGLGKMDPNGEWEALAREANAWSVNGFLHRLL